MRFKAHFKHKSIERFEYHRTIDADSLEEAIKIADKWARKGFVCVTIKST